MDPRNKYNESDLKQACETMGQAQEALAGTGAAIGGIGPNLLGRLHNRRRQLESELYKVNNSIRFCEQNAGLVEIVEVVLASREKAEPRPIGY